MKKSIIAMASAVLLVSSLASAQTVGVRGTAKGSSTALGVTSTPVDANHTALDVAIVSGSGGDGGGVIRDGTGDTTQMNVDNGRAQVQNYNPNLAADNSTNSTAKVPVIVCVASASAASHTEGRQVPCRTDLQGSLVVRALDPCSGVAKQYLPINISTATTTEITASLAGASNHYYVCSINIGPVAGAQNLALVDDDSDGCGSVTSGLAGGTTASSGWNIAANGGLTMGDGLGSIARTGGTNRVLCLVSSTTAQTSGVITVVAAP